MTVPRTPQVGTRRRLPGILLSAMLALAPAALRAGARVVLRDPAPHDGPAFRGPVAELRRWFLPSLDFPGEPPDDPLYRHQWHMRAVRAEEAWPLATGEGVVVAVIDTGVAFEDHKDCRRMVDLAGTRFVEGFDVLGRSPHANDRNSHGTHVAGTVAQSTNNGVGVVGVAWGAAVMPVRVLSATGTGTSAGVADGIRWATDHGADVINLSLGAHSPSEVVRRAVVHALDRGVVVVAAAGNRGRRGVAFPAAFEGVVAVGAVDREDEPAFYSSYGPEVDLVAPGGDTRADRDGDGYPDGVLQNTFPWRQPEVVDEYVMYMGTSMATPHVAGAAALLVQVLRARGVPRTEWPERVRDLLVASARSPHPDHDRERYGAGVLDVLDAVRLAREVRAAAPRGAPRSGRPRYRR